MLAVPPLLSSSKDERADGGFDSFSIGLEELSGASLLDSIDFDDLFTGLEDGDVLPDLEMDPEILADFSINSGSDGGSDGGGGGGEEVSNTDAYEENKALLEEALKKEEEVRASSVGLDSSSSTQGEEVASGRKDVGTSTMPNPSKKGRKPSTQSKNSQGKRKVKVDWTPELHRRFVQAVEQLGVDKAVPSRILEMMGIDCLTRHNIASHLQKYRSHRKHLLAREAEAASWHQRRQMYGAAMTAGGGKGGNVNPWLAPTMGFPPIVPMHPYRPLHVWGHPTADQSLVHMWPNKHLVAPPPPPQAWPPPLAPTDPPFWHQHPHRVPGGLMPPAPVTSCFPQPMPPMMHGYGVAAAVPPHLPPLMYRSGGTTVPAAQTAPAPHLLLDCQPSKESIDAAIGDVMSKPWLPLPLGLKPPSTDSVMVELQRQGIPKIPPATTSA